MNKVILMGRLTRDPDVRYSAGGGDQQAYARYTVAVDRRLILSAASHLEEVPSSQSSICAREQRSLSPAGSRRVNIRTRTDRLYSPRM